MNIAQRSKITSNIMGRTRINKLTRSTAIQTIARIPCWRVTTLVKKMLHLYFWYSRKNVIKMLIISSLVIMRTWYCSYHTSYLCFTQKMCCHHKRKGEDKLPWTCWINTNRPKHQLTVPKELPSDKWITLTNELHQLRPKRKFLQNN